MNSLLEKIKSPNARFVLLILISAPLSSNAFFHSAPPPETRNHSPQTPQLEEISYQKPRLPELEEMSWWRWHCIEPFDQRKDVKVGYAFGYPTQPAKTREKIPNLIDSVNF